MFSLTVSPAWAGPFAKMPKDHWTYDSIRSLVRARVLEGPSEILLKGARVYTRFDMASMLCPALDRLATGSVTGENVALIEKLALEFSDELQLMGKDPSSALVSADSSFSSAGSVEASDSDMDTASSGSAEEGNTSWYNSPDSLRVSMDGDVSFLLRHTRRNVDTTDNDWDNEVSIGFNTFMNIDPRVFAFLRMQNESIPLDELGAQEDGFIDQLYVDIKDIYGLMDIRVGRQYLNLGHSIVLDDKSDGIRFSKNSGRFRLDLFAFDTRDARQGINEQDYGDASGTKNFWLFDDTYDLTGAADAAGRAMVQSNDRGSIANYNSNVNSTLPVAGRDQITLYTSPFSEPTPFDGFRTVATIPQTTAVNSNPGTGLQVAGATLLLPLDLYTAGTMTAAGNGGAVDSGGMEIQQMAGSALARDWQVKSSNGLDSYGARLAADMGEHTLTAYFLQRSYDRYDPYTMLGDPWAALADRDNNGQLDLDAAGRQVSPRADPWYLGLTMDGNLAGGLDYFFEFVHFDPDITNVGVNPLKGTSRDALGKWNGNNMATGSAWLVGMDWTFSQRLGMVLQYGAGTEEFLPASIYWRRSFNGMKGRLNTASPSLSMGRDYDEGTYSLTGITDFLFKVRAELNEKTRGFALFESVADNDTSLNRLIAGDPDVTGHSRQDYSMFTLHMEHSYSTNATVSAEYTYCAYDDPALNTSRFQGNSGAWDDVEWGGWSRVQTELKVTF
jgi:hypothetical protein